MRLRPEADVAEADDPVDALSLEIGENRLQPEQVAVDIADHSDSHRAQFARRLADDMASVVTSFAVLTRCISYRACPSCANPRAGSSSRRHARTLSPRGAAGRGRYGPRLPGGTRSGRRRVVALKVMRFELIEDPVFGRRFEQEARAASEVRETTSCPCSRRARPTDAATSRRNTSRAGRSRTGSRRGTLDPKETAPIRAGRRRGARCAPQSRDRPSRPQAVEHHRRCRRKAMLTDFGLAKGRAYTVLTKPGQVMGTIDYLAPELIKGEAASPATDIYALGCTMYECVTGQPPFADKEGIAGRAGARRRAPARPTGLPWRPLPASRYVDALQGSERRCARAKEPAQAAARRRPTTAGRLQEASG